MAKEQTDDHKSAVDLATTDKEGNSTAPFTKFDEASAKIISDNGSATTEELRNGRSLAFIGTLLTVLLGVAAAVAVARGMGARRKEYA
jgi:ABC-type spermidine/putrescine transport system permease subunit II